MIRKYDSVYDMMLEYRPSDKVIEDDERFDKWYDGFQYEQELRARKRAGQIDNVPRDIPGRASKRAIDNV